MTNLKFSIVNKTINKIVPIDVFKSHILRWCLIFFVLLIFVAFLWDSHTRGLHKTKIQSPRITTFMDGPGWRWLLSFSFDFCLNFCYFDSRFFTFNTFHRSAQQVLVYFRKGILSSAWKKRKFLIHFSNRIARHYNVNRINCTSSSNWTR